MTEVDKKTELLEVYDMRENFIEVLPRKDIYRDLEAAHKKEGKITRQLRTVRALIMNTKGRILLQKRSGDKRYNANLYDKTLGGHCNHRQQSDLALVTELAEELGAPGFVCSSADFLYNLKHIDLRVIGLFKSLGYQSGWISHRKGNPDMQVPDMNQPLMNHFYFGVYDGKFTWADSEVRGLNSYTLDELTRDMEKDPDDFTQDLRNMLPMYQPHVEDVRERFDLC